LAHGWVRGQGLDAHRQDEVELGESDVLDGKVDGDKVSFGELLKFEGMELKVTYTGTIGASTFLAAHDAVR
jgi:hypothetical protein